MSSREFGTDRIMYVKLRLEVIHSGLGIIDTDLIRWLSPAHYPNGEISRPLSELARLLGGSSGILL